MAVTSIATTVSTTATLIATHTDSSKRSLSVLVRCNGGKTIYVGGSGVDSTAGTDVANNEDLSLNLGPGEDLYAVVTTGTTSIKVITNLGPFSGA